MQSLTLDKILWNKHLAQSVGEKDKFSSGKNFRLYGYHNIHTLLVSPDLVNNHQSSAHHKK